MKPKAIFCWSGGKDSALALYRVLKEDQVEVVALLTTLNSEFKRISMHGVREDLLDMQAASIGFPLVKMYVKEGGNDEYERNMSRVLMEYKDKGVRLVIFGDIFLEDLREYRENNLQKIGMQASFPLWKENTGELIREFLKLGFKTVTCCVNDAFLSEAHVGVDLNPEFIEALPPDTDPCGENGEYHTFCYAGPIFKKKVNFLKGEKVYRPLEVKFAEGNGTKGFWFCELLPA
ncbi:MAG TPA: diphthine--ammonia ligase [Bacteroidia bacterium]|jgi:uncharacterized protein (TIGR00290 family)